MNSPFRHSWLGSAILLLVALPLISGAAPPHCGIQGRTHIYVGPIIIGPPPVVVPAVVTLFPVATTFTVVSARSGRMVAHASSDSDGNFTVPLPPGPYVIVPDEIADTRFCSYLTPTPFEVTVRPGSFTGAGFTYIGNCHLIFVGVSPTLAP